MPQQMLLVCKHVEGLLRGTISSKHADARSASHLFASYFGLQLRVFFGGTFLRVGLQ